jgi:hypothetical protein
MPAQRVVRCIRNVVRKDMTQKSIVHLAFLFGGGSLRWHNAHTIKEKKLNVCVTFQNGNFAHAFVLKRKFCPEESVRNMNRSCYACATLRWHSSQPIKSDKNEGAKNACEFVATFLRARDMNCSCHATATLKLSPRK